MRMTESYILGGKGRIFLLTNGWSRSNVRGMKNLFLVAFLLGGCAVQPALTYDEMYDAYYSAATPKEKKEYQKMIDKFESDVETANKFYANKAACVASTPQYTWYCRRWGPSSTDYKKVQFDSLDKLVKTWRDERTECSCVSSQDLRRAMSQMSGGLTY